MQLTIKSGQLRRRPHCGRCGWAVCGIVDAGDKNKTERLVLCANKVLSRRGGSQVLFRHAQSHLRTCAARCLPQPESISGPAFMGQSLSARAGKSSMSPVRCPFDFRQHRDRCCSSDFFWWRSSTMAAKIFARPLRSPSVLDFGPGFRLHSCPVLAVFARPACRFA